MSLLIVLFCVRGFNVHFALKGWLYCLHSGGESAIMERGSWDDIGRCEDGIPVWPAVFSDALLSSPERHVVGILSKLARMLKSEAHSEIFGVYRTIGEPVAEGPMSVVYKASGRAADDGAVAIKILKDSAARVARRLSDQPGRQWEGERAVELNHRNVVRTLEFGCESGAFYVVMEYIDGPSLAWLIHKQSPLLHGRRLSIIRQIAHGLAYIHRTGLIHRDICPKNVLVDGTGHAKLIDFGVAVSQAEKLKDTGRRTGRPSYMAPELIRDNVFDVRTDIYALGVAMYEISTGARPLAGADRYETMRLHLYSAPTPPAHVNDSVPLALSNIIVRCLAKDPEQRFQTVDELLQELPEAAF